MAQTLKKQLCIQTRQVCNSAIFPLLLFGIDIFFISWMFFIDGVSSLNTFFTESISTR